MMRCANVAVWLVVGCAWSATVAAGVISVPGDHATIQAAIDAASDGDEIVIGPGTYPERLVIVDKDVTLRGSAGAGSTIVDGEGATSSVLRVQRSDVDLEGITFRRGEGTVLRGDPYGGGMLLVRSTVNVFQCVITDNGVQALAIMGAGIAAYQGSITIEDTVVEENGTTCNPLGCAESNAGSGPGLFAIDCDVLAIDSRFEKNYCTGNGGGFYVVDGQSARIERCHVIDNEACRGAGIYVNGVAAEILDNVIESNASFDCGGGQGGGVWASPDSIVARNTISFNDGGDGAGGVHGAGLVYGNRIEWNRSIYGPGGVSTLGPVVNCTVLDNRVVDPTGANGAGAASGGWYNCIIRDNVAPTSPNLGATAVVSYSNVEGGWPGVGNLDADPRIVDGRLQLDSPCLDVGTDTAPGLDGFDFEGDARILDGDGDGTATIDMGADEGLREVAVRYGVSHDVLRLNGSAGDARLREVAVDEGSAIVLDIQRPSSSNGRFVIHANPGVPSAASLRVLPASIGTIGFPFLLADGASPVAVWNNLGREGDVGSNAYFGTPTVPPGPAPVDLLDLAGGDLVNLPTGTIVTFQGIVQDDEAASPKSVRVTNAVVLHVR